MELVVPQGPALGPWFRSTIERVPDARIDHLGWLVHDLYVRSALAGDLDAATRLLRWLEDPRLRFERPRLGEAAVSALAYAMGAPDPMAGARPLRSELSGHGLEARVLVAEGACIDSLTTDPWLGVPIPKGDPRDLSGRDLYRRALADLRAEIDRGVSLARIPGAISLLRRIGPDLGALERVTGRGIASQLERLADERSSEEGVELSWLERSRTLTLLAFVRSLECGGEPAARARLRQLYLEVACWPSVGPVAEEALWLRPLAKLFAAGVLLTTMELAPGELSHRVDELEAVIEARLEVARVGAGKRRRVRRSVPELLDQLGAAYGRIGLPTLREMLEPGRSRAEILARLDAAGLGGRVHEDVIELFAWQDGPRPDPGGAFLLDDGDLLSLDAAIGSFLQLGRILARDPAAPLAERPRWLPLTTDDAGGGLAVICDPTSSEHGAVIRHQKEWDDPLLTADLRSYLAMTIERVRAMRRGPDGTWREGPSTTARIRARYRPPEI